jgi:putative endonuclease
MSYWVYVIKSEIDGRLYKGLTSDISKRILEHNKGKSFSTKPYRPWKLIYSKAFEDRSSARDYEKYLKTGSGRDYLKSIENQNT